MDQRPAQLSLAQGRLCVALAALLWSTSGAFTKLLTQATALHLDTPAIDPLRIAFFRVLFAGLVLLPTVKRPERRFQPMMLPMVLSFATMNAAFITAQAWGTAANAVLLQYTAPMWMYLASIWWLGERSERRNWIALAVGLAGVAVIVSGGGRSQLPVILIALGSGVAYAGVIVCLRVLRDISPRWLTVVNHLFSALVLLPVLLSSRWTASSPAQYATLVLFGTLQMALPYWLVARGLSVVSPQEAGTITLLEPIFNPVWAYLVSPGTETPSLSTWIGGGCIVGALAWRYWPRATRPCTDAPERKEAGSGRS